MKKIFIINSCAKLFALFCILAFSVGNAWANYYKAEIVCVYDGEAKDCYVFATTAYGTPDADDARYTLNGYTTDAIEQGWSYFDIYLHAKPSDGYNFMGWYRDALCTNPINTQEHYNYWSYSDSDIFTYSENAEDAPITKIYAKFTSLAKAHHYARIQYIMDGEKRGAFQSSSEYKYSKTSSFDKESFSEKESYTYNTINVVSKRGYTFTKWTIEGENAEYGTHYNWDTEEYIPYTNIDNPAEINIVNVTSSDPENPDNVTVSAGYEALSSYTLTVQKAKNRGSVTILCQNYLENEGKDGLELQTLDWTGLTAEDNSRDYAVYSTDAITLTAIPEVGYEFKGWYSIDGEGVRTKVADDAEFIPSITADVTYYAYFNKPYTAEDVFQVGMVTCKTFDEAIAAASSSSDKVILQLQNYSVPAGNYTIPVGVTLLVPRDNSQVSPSGNKVDRLGDQNIPSGAYRTLTLENGVNLVVSGAIEVGGYQSVGTAGTGGDKGVGRPGGSGKQYGQIILQEGSHITLNNGAQLRAWGFITGEMTPDANGNYPSGEIHALRGSIVREQFQMQDWKGGSCTSTMVSETGENQLIYKVFPVTQYYIQNIEVPTTYRPGAKLIGSTGVNLSWLGMYLTDAIGIVGAEYSESRKDSAMFLMNNEDDSEDTWVRKTYDVKNDLQVYEVNNSARLGSLIFSLSGTEMDSRKYILPITNNMKIHLLSGEMQITQATELLPGSQIEVNKKATVTINSGQTLYLYDADNWGNYVRGTTDGSNDVFTYAGRVKYRPGGRPNVRTLSAVGLGDAKLNVHGSLNVEGALKTTDNGAEIYSNLEDAGTVIFSTAAPTASEDDLLYQTTSTGPAYGSNHCIPALLTNGAGSTYGAFRQTAGTAAGQSFCYIDFDGDGKGEWKSLTVVDDIFVKDESNIYYIKPGAYVPIKQGSVPEEQADHTYHDEYKNSGRMFILATGNQWWEVTQVGDNLFKCEHPNNTTYYYYDELEEGWLEKKFKVTWLNWDGSPVTYKNDKGNMVNYYYVTYNTVPDWKGSTPTHVDDASHTYSFSGWLPTPAPVTEDVTYVAQFAERDRMYAITFNDENDELIQLVYCKLGEVPVCSKHELAANEQWSPAVGAVAGDQTYKLADKNNDGPFTITFVNWDGKTIGEAQSVEKNAMPVTPADPTKADDDLHSYTFADWTPAVTPATADATYTATYTTAPRTYIVTWKNGAVTLGTTKVAYGETPEYTGDTPIHGDDLFVGWTPAIKAVTDNATYTAQFIPSGMTITTKQTVSDNQEVNNLRIATNGNLTITGTVTTGNFYLESDGTHSGQLTGGEDKLTINGNAYFDFAINAKTHTWYAVAVPWQVDATNGISVNGRTLTLGKDFDIIYYNGALRAEQGKKKCWSYVENDDDKTLYPGRLYMIALMSDASVIRFAKKDGAALLTTTTSVKKYVQTTGDDKDANWNGVANPALFYAYVNAGATVGQVYNPANNSYDPINMSSAKMVVGQGAFVQAPADKNITVAYGVAFAAPRRANTAGALHDICIAPADDAYTDRLFIQTDEDKEQNTYTIGQDLVKVGVSSKVAQMWVARYDDRLCLNTQKPVNGTADYPLGISVPQTGEYTISLQPSDVDTQSSETLYLTFNGSPVWNLNYGAYTTTFEKGTTTEYGLRLVGSNAPQITTGIGNVPTGDVQCTKVLRDGVIYILRGNNVYSIDGQLIK